MYWSQTFLKPDFGGHKSFLWFHWYPCFGLLVTSSLGFKVRNRGISSPKNGHMSTKNFKKEYIPLGCVKLAHWPYAMLAPLPPHMLPCHACPPTMHSPPHHATTFADSNKEILLKSCDITMGMGEAIPVEWGWGQNGPKMYTGSRLWWVKRLKI